MQVILQSNTRFVLRFQKDEDVFSSLLSFCSQSNIQAASFEAIGAAKEVTLSYYTMEKKVYEDLRIVENVEITSMLGTVAMLDTKPVVHAHGTFSKKNFSVIGGHIKQILVSATCEMALSKYEGTMRRKFDDETGLNLLS